MRTPPPLADFHKFPVTSGVGVLAVLATLAWHSAGIISPLVMDFRAWQGEPWRLLTSALPHVNILHLVFNLYWLWVFGSAVEATFGWLRTAAIYVFFAAGSAAADYAIFDGGVGLSGVGYGLFGLLWVLSRQDDRFHDAVDDPTIRLFVAWFFICIALTVTKILPVGNVAHGMGAIQGVLLGFALSGQRGKRFAIASLTGLMFVVLVAATVGRPFVNLSGHLGHDLAYIGYLEMEAGANESAADLYEQAVRLDASQAGWWFNLGIAYQQLGRHHEATDAYRQAWKLEPSSLHRQTLTEWSAALAYEKQTAGDNKEAAELYREALELDDQNATNWYNLGISCANLGRLEAATSAFEKAVALAPDDAKFREALEALQNHRKNVPPFRPMLKKRFDDHGN